MVVVVMPVGLGTYDQTLGAAYINAAGTAVVFSQELGCQES